MATHALIQIYKSDRLTEHHRFSLVLELCFFIFHKRIWEFSTQFCPVG